MFARVIRFVPIALLCVAALAEAQPAPPTGTLSGPAINFGNQTVGTTSAPQATTVTAVVVPPTGWAARINTIGTSNPEFAVTGGTCQAGVTSLGDAGNCTVQIAFTPSVQGPRNGTLSVNCTLLGTIGAVAVICNSANIALTGVGIAVAALQAVPALGREALTALAILLMLGSMYYVRRRKN